MFRSLVSLSLKIVFVAVAISIGIGIGIANAPTAQADNANGPFISAKMRDEMVDYQQLTYTLQCLPTSTMENGEYMGAAGLENMPAGDMVIATNNQLSKQRVLDQGIFGASSGRGSMFDNKALTCDMGVDFGFVWPFTNFGRNDLVDFFCSLPSVYHNSTGGRGRAVGGGSNKAACKSGTKFTNGKSYFIVKSGSNLRNEVRAELAKTTRGKIAAKDLTPEKKYLQYWMTFDKACGAKITTEYPTNGTDPATNNGSIYRIPVVNQNGTVVDFIANTGGESTDSRKTMLDASDQAYPGSTTCGQLAIGMRQYAPAYANYMKGPGKNDTSATDGTGIPENIDKEWDEEATSCAVDNIGWIICPVVNFMAKIVDESYKWVATLLTVQPLNINTQSDDNTMYSAWSMMRNFANISFVIAFLIIIYSQMTGAGISNYGIKKMVPKLIVAVILVNTSYWICAIAVDISNIAGTSLKGLFDAAGARLETPSFGKQLDGASGWSVLAVFVLGATIVWLGLSLLLPALVAALAAIVTVFLVLTLRQALIILLVVISPLAFVANLLPNTEEWFKKWLSLFKTLLLMFPIIAVIFGASAIASIIVMNSATDSSGDGIVAIQIMGALISIIPLALTPVVMKTAGGVLNRFAGMVNNPNKGPFDRMRKGAENYRKNRQDFRNLKAINGGMTLSPGRGTLARRRARRQAVLDNRQSEMKRSTAGYVADLANSDTEAGERFRDQLAGGGGSGAHSRALANAINVKAQLEADEIKAEKVVIQDLPRDELRAALGGAEVGSAKHTALMQRSVETNDLETINKLWESGDVRSNEKARTALADSLASSSSRPAYLGQGQLDNMRRGTKEDGSAIDTVDTAIDTAAIAGKYSPEKIATATNDELEVIRKANTTGAAKVKLQAASRAALTDATLGPKMGDNRNSAGKMAGNIWS